MKLVSRHFSGARNLKVARTSLENIWNLDANMFHMRPSRFFMDPEINSLPTQINEVSVILHKKLTFPIRWQP
jgi:hypothetical protein